MQISPCLQNVALLLKPHHHLCKIDRTMDKKVFPAKHFIKKKNKKTIHLLLVAKNSRFSYVHGHTHVTFGDTSRDFIGRPVDQNWSRFANHRNLDQTII